MFRPESRPEQCTVVYRVELVLRRGYSWEAMIPTKEEHIFGWLRSMDYRKNMRKKRRDEILAHARFVRGGELSDEETQDVLEKEFDPEELRLDEELRKKARHILEEVTRGSWHEGKDSPIPNDFRFKRTRKGNLYTGAGNVLAMLGEVAFRDEDNQGIKRRLKSRTWITPGKLVFLRPKGYNARGGGRNTFIPLTRADGRSERHIPPEPPSPANRFREKPATMKFAERIDPPAHLRFYLCATEDIMEDKLARWFKIAEEYGINGGRITGQGKFDVWRFIRLNDEWRANFFAQERTKMETDEACG